MINNLAMDHNPIIIYPKQVWELMHMGRCTCTWEGDASNVPPLVGLNLVGKIGGSGPMQTTNNRTTTTTPATTSFLATNAHKNGQLREQ